MALELSSLNKKKKEKEKEKKMKERKKEIDWNSRNIERRKAKQFLRTKPGITFYETCSKHTLAFSEFVDLRQQEVIT